MKLIWLTALAILFANSATYGAANQCTQYMISKGLYGDGQGRPGEGKLEYCDNGTDQRIYLSGSLDEEERGNRDLMTLKKVITEKFKTRKTGVFTVVTNNAGGGNTDWHKMLIMAVEDSCKENCRIETEVLGRCESACNQLHLTCVAGARTSIRKGGQTCDHAETDEEECHGRDPNPPYERDICPIKEQIAIYKDRCGKLLKNRNLKIDLDRKRRIFEFIDSQARKGVFSTSRLTCTPLPWAEVEVAAPAPLDSEPSVR